ncbi:MAG TPA: CocE/NonD family hydrolase [Mycobacteriales bacterium]|nr:CocE/NonD family hydrolase [Mycobacteriales bacterium]
MRLSGRRLSVSVVTVALAASSAATASAAGGQTSAAPPTASALGVFAGHTMDGSPMPCTTRSDGIRVCVGNESGVGKPDYRLASFDGTPLATYVTLPAAAAPAHGYPLVVESHGWGDPPTGPGDHQYGGPSPLQWARQGYAVLQMAARGWGNSCGKLASRLVDPAACANGFIHMDDYRYEARDVEHAVGLLVDEGFADPDRIGVMGESYGAGVSLELATLNNRVMLPDGKLVPWRSPDGTPLHIAAAAPFATWSDLVYALAPNGRTFDDSVTSPTADLSPIGVMKTSIMSGLFLVGTESGYIAAPGVDPQANITAWYVAILAGEPYTLPIDHALLRQASEYHSPYYLLGGDYRMRREAPAPLLISNGFTDDVFPADEALRYYNLERRLYPHDPISLFFGDVGHQRADNKPADDAQLQPRVEAFFNHYVKGSAPAPALGVTAMTQSCPVSTKSAGPFHAATWAALHPTAVTYRSASVRTLLSVSGSPLVGKTFDPVFGGLACTTAPSTGQGPGVASYSLPVARGNGYTLLGAPTVTADLTVTGTTSSAYLAERLLDVNPATKTETLVARGLYRIDPKHPDGRQTFQLHPAGWHFAAGHVAKLELLGEDAPYSRPANGVYSVSVSNLELTLPTH